MSASKRLTRPRSVTRGRHRLSQSHGWSCLVASASQVRRQTTGMDEQQQ